MTDLDLNEKKKSYAKVAKIYVRKNFIHELVTKKGIYAIFGVTPQTSKLQL